VSSSATVSYIGVCRTMPGNGTVNSKGAIVGHMLPKISIDKLPGAVCTQYIRCGKPNCKCAHGQLHGPYHYRFWRDNKGRQHKEYVKKADLERVRAACLANCKEQGKIQRVLAMGPRMVKWLRGEGIKWADDPAEQVLEVLELRHAVDWLVALSTMEIGKTSQQIRAAGFMLDACAALLLPDVASRSQEASVSHLALLEMWSGKTVSVSR
jgi:hypothetical protein